jgi:hypothetical protein
MNLRVPPTMLADTAALPPHVSDRAAWAIARASGVAEQVLALADEACAIDVPPYGYPDWRHYQATGERLDAERRFNLRRNGTMRLALAYGLTQEPRYLTHLERYLAAIVEEPSWLFVAHDFGELPDNLPSDSFPAIDLMSAMTCHLVAEVITICGDALPAELVARARAMALLRGPTFYLARRTFNWETGRTGPNWEPVCAGGVAIAALLLDDDGARKEAVLAQAEAHMRHYLGTFPEDGGCLEGVGYWEKGIAYFAMFADMLERWQPGRASLFDDPRFATIAGFPARAALTPGRFPAFSDTALRRTIQPALLHRLARRLDLPALLEVDTSDPLRREFTERFLGEQLRDLFWYNPAQATGTGQLAPVDVLPQSQWFIARDVANGIAVALKGGANDEPHNHNDVGSFVLLQGDATPIAELGAPIYDRAFFRPDTRYGYLAAGSQGHSVPVVAGLTQRAGSGTRALAFEAAHDAGETAVTLDLAPAYPPEAGLASLVRRLALRHGAEPVITLHDTATFAGAPASFASVLISFGHIDLSAPGRVVIRDGEAALSVVYDPDQCTPSVETHADVALRAGRLDVHRLIFTHRAPAATASIRLSLHPLPSR